MDTTQKGNLLEDKAYRLFENLINAGDFYYPKEKTKLLKKPKYYSRDRESDITFDISIECWLQGVETPSQVVLIECKNCDHRISVDDVEEFKSKRDQINANKGIMVSSHGFQKAAANYARNNGIGLIRFPREGEHSWILHRSAARTHSDVSIGENVMLSDLISGIGIVPPLVDAVYLSESGCSVSFWAFSKDLLWDRTSPEILKNEPRTKSNSIPYLLESQIEMVAATVLQSTGSNSLPVDLDNICAIEKRACNLAVMRIQKTASDDEAPLVLGRFLLTEGIIELFERQGTVETQLRFTLAHELGHHFLKHKNFLMMDTVDQSDIDYDKARPVASREIARLEWQANRFASALLMPKDGLLERLFLLVEKLNLKDRGHGIIYIDSQPCNMEAFSAVCANLAKVYAVSFGAVAARLGALGVLNDQRIKRPDTRMLSELLKSPLDIADGNGFGEDSQTDAI